MSIEQAYTEIAMERPHVCTGCGGKHHLSHSHLIPRSYRKDLQAVKDNIVYHCLPTANDCHTKWEGMMAPTLNDFVANMVYVFNTDQTYFWKRFFKLHDHWVTPDRALEYNDTKADRELYDKALANLGAIEERVQRIQMGIV